MMDATATRMRLTGTALLWGLAVATAVPAAAQEPVAGAAGTFETFVAPLGAASATFEGAVATGDVVTVREVVIRWELPAWFVGSGEAPLAVTVGLPEIRFESVARDGERHAARRVVLPEVRLSGGSASTVLTDVVVEAPSWPAAPLAALEPPGPVAAMEPALRWLAGVEAESVSLGTPGARITTGPVEDGRIASLALVPKEEEGRLDITGIDIGAFVAALYGMDAAAPRKTLIERAVLSGIVDTTDEGADIAIASLSLNNLSAGMAAPSAAAGLDALIALDAAGAAVAPEARATALGCLADLLAVDRLALEGFSANEPGLERFHVGSIVLDGVAPGGTANFVLEDLAGEGIDQETGEYRSVTIGRLAHLGVGLPDAGAVARLAAGDPSLATILAAVPRIGRMEVEGVVAETEAGDFRIGEAAIDFAGHIGPIPTRIAYAGDYRIETPPTIPAEVAETFLAAGVDALAVSETMTAAWDPATEALAVDWRGVADGIASYRLAFTLTGLSRVVFESPDRAAETVATLALADALVEIGDRGASAIGLALLERAGGTREEALAAVADALETGVAPFVPLPLGSGPHALAERLLGGEVTVTVAARPERPLPLAQLAAAATLAPLQLTALLGLSLDVAP